MSFYDKVAQEGPEVWMPEAEQAAVTAAYARADVILEYGAGGSTRLAADMPGKTVISIESDPEWRDAVAAFIGKACTGTARIIHADIGPTVKFGYPKHWWRLGAFRRYAALPWAGAHPHPDVVLIDGRFRIGCFVATYLSITKPVTVLWDDYAKRAQYRVVEWIARPAAMAGDMARFELAPASGKRRRARFLAASMGLIAS